MDAIRAGCRSRALSARSQFVLGFIAVAVLFSGAQAQKGTSPLTLPQAVTIALEKNPLHKAALAETRASSSDVVAARSFLLPHLSFSETATRGGFVHLSRTIDAVPTGERVEQVPGAPETCGEVAQGKRGIITSSI